MTTKERARPDFRIKEDWRESGVSFEGVNLPARDLTLSVEVGDYTQAAVHFAPKQGETVVDGTFVEYLADPGQRSHLRIVFGPDYITSSVERDGVEVHCKKAWARVKAGEPTEVGFTEMSHSAGEPCDDEITGYLIAD